MSLLTRDAWRSLPLQFVVIPTLDAPTLAFLDEREVSATMIQERILDLHTQYRRTPDPKKRTTLAARIRKLHLARVSRAIGVCVPGHPGVIHEFVD